MEPISVTIKNFTKSGRTLYWLGKEPKWIDSGASITIDYEPWSCVTDAQRESMLTELSRKMIAFTMHVINKDGGYVNVDYDPSVLCKKPAITVQVPVQPAVEKPSEFDVKYDNKTHIVVAGGEGRDQAKYLGFKSEPVTPPNRGNNVDPKTGFRTDIVDTDANSRTVVTTDVLKKSAVEAEGLVEAPVEEAEPEEQPHEHTVADLFNELTAEKKWNEALQVLINEFGKDKITFTTRALMSLKTWDAVVAKYKLAD